MRDFASGLGVATVVWLTAGFILCLALMAHAEGEGYKRGQVDALSGRCIKYQLVVNPDSTRTWEQIPERWGR